ncbi:MAG: phage tail protein [Ilumatobacteraceae bacterium]
MTSARGQLDGLQVRSPIGQALPAMFHEDAFAQRLCDGLDSVLAPVPSTIDNFWAYLDPTLAPLDFVEWLAGWVGIELDQTWPEERRRELVGRAIQLYERRGTAEGLADLIELYIGERPTVEDTGGVAWSAAPGTALPGSGQPAVVVRLEADEASVDARRLENMVVTNKPAHVAHRIEFRPARRRRTADLPPPPPAADPGPPGESNEQ